MRRTLAIVGLLLLLPQTAGAALDPLPLYDLLREVSLKELQLRQPKKTEGPTQASELLLEHFTLKSMPEGWALKAEDIDGTLRGELQELCKQRNDESKDYAECHEMLNRIQRSLLAEEKIRSLGRHLQIIATGMEQAVRGWNESTSDPLLRYESILALWRAGTGSVKTGTGLTIRSQMMRDGLEGHFQKIREALSDLIELQGDDPEKGKINPEQLAAAVARYQYGYRLVAGERTHEFPPPLESGPEDDLGTERQYLYARWFALEEALRALYDAMPDASALKTDEVLFFTVPEKYREIIAPKNERNPEVGRWLRDITVWVYRERLKKGSPGATGENGILTGDAGLSFEVPIEPVLPSLCTHEEGNSTENCSPIDGGRYPPPPQDGRGLCTFPFARKGFLCRPIDEGESGVQCSDEATLRGTDAILLTACRSRKERGTGTGETLTGPDVCQELGWKLGKQTFDPRKQCTVSIRCAAQCVPGVDASAQTQRKDSTGKIPICINERPELPATYLVFHELVHARQKCDLPPLSADDLFESAKTKEEKLDRCCLIEGEAYRVQCKALEDDGYFTEKGRRYVYVVDDQGNGQVVTPGSGATIPPGQQIEFNAVTCAEVLTNFACGPQQKLGPRCPGNNDYPLGFFGELLKLEQKNPAGVPVTCSEAIQKPDPRVTATLRDIELVGREVCTPNTLTETPNTIGNNMCFIGQCVEQSLETHRLIPGRAPFVSGDEAYPVDACVAPMKNPSTLALPGPPPSVTLPAYRPEALIAELDAALCQVNGLPPSSLPILCAVESQRRLHTLLDQYLPSAESLATQPAEQQTPEAELLRLSSGIGTRIGARLWERHIERISRSLADLTKQAATLLTPLATMTFTTEACPRNGEDTPLQSHAVCAAQASSASSASSAIGSTP